VFNGWEHLGKNIRNTEKWLQLTSGDFHSGSTFNGDIRLDEEDEIELREAIKKGFHPVFWVTN